MAPASYTHIVFGYGTGLDWRPTTFVSPFPSSRLCSVCGLVPPSDYLVALRSLHLSAMLRQRRQQREEALPNRQRVFRDH
ncbi:hypothetical protein MTO96_008767 [Rhipicephalus appendiculatus]